MKHFLFLILICLLSTTATLALADNPCAAGKDEFMGEAVKAFQSSGHQVIDKNVSSTPFNDLANNEMILVEGYLFKDQKIVFLSSVGVCNSSNGKYKMLMTSSRTKKNQCALN
ncbi:hypothetical protein WDW86_07305 [Bdellovibrionota bacterium FG-2]